MFGKLLTEAFRNLKSILDPEGLLTQIIDAPAMNTRELFRLHLVTGWTILKHIWTGPLGRECAGFQGAVEMCNNNGACRKLKGGVMCPSFRATRDEKDSTRGRANTLRLAISGQLGGTL